MRPDIEEIVGGNGQQAEKIGVLVAHGMGEQIPGAHVQVFCERMRRAIQALHPAARINQRIVNPNPAVLCLKVSRDLAAPVELYFHEAYWADLDDESTFWVRLKFWWWGFSMWSRTGQRFKILPGTRKHMDVRRIDRAALCLARLKLFLAANISAAAVVPLRLVTQPFLKFPIAGRFISLLFSTTGFRPLETIVAYLGDVKLYQERKERSEPLEHVGYKPRVAIRRRAIRRMVDVALADYARWYVAAHSLGSIVAFNALMETAEALPNYLDRATCARLRARGWLAVQPGSQPKTMEPKRPFYVRQDERLDRQKLFAKLRGFMTYGSPIDKYSALWPVIVPVNEERNVFQPSFEWINVYEQLDPVGGFLDLVNIEHARQKGGRTSLPANYGYRTRATLITAHTHYFARPERAGRLPRTVADWFLNPARTFPPPNERAIPGGSQRQPFQAGLYVQTFLAYVLLLVLGGMALAASWPTVELVWDLAFDALSGKITWAAAVDKFSRTEVSADSPFWPKALRLGLYIAAVSFCVVLTVGLLHLLYRRYLAPSKMDRLARRRVRRRNRP